VFFKVSIEGKKVSGKQIQPDQAAIQIAYQLSGKPASLEQMLATPAQRAVLMARARKHMRNRMKFDLKKLQAGDFD
jgi:hypothetical protein